MNKRYKLYQSDSLASSPALPLIVQGWAQMLEKGMADPHSPNVVSSDHHVLWVEDTQEANQVVAAMSYMNYQSSNTFWICVSYVRPEYRRLGLYKTMYSRLKQLARKGSYSSICSGVVESNTVMQETAQSTGRKKFYSVWKEDLKPTK